jgi:hypothetical protein
VDLADQLLIEAFLNGKIGDGMVHRDQYICLRIKELLRNQRKPSTLGFGNMCCMIPEEKPSAVF